MSSVRQRSGLVLAAGLLWLSAAPLRADETAPPVPPPPQTFDQVFGPQDWAAPPIPPPPPPPAPSAPPVVSELHVCPGTCVRRPRASWRRWTLGLYGSSTFVDGPDGVLGTTPPAGLQTLNWSENEYLTAAGGRFRAVHRPTQRTELEARAIYYGQWDDASRQAGQFAFENGPGVSPVASATFESELIAYGADVMAWKTTNPCRRVVWRGGVGVRALRLEEEATARDWVGLAPDSFLQATADTTFLAGQVGGGVAWKALRWLEIFAEARVLAGAALAEAEVNEVSILSGGPKASQADETEFTFGGEVTLGARWRFARRWAGVLAYEVLYLDRTASAPGALDFSQAATGAVQPRVSTEDRFLHTLWAGLEIDL
jgi:hypothetical protein